MTLDLESVKVTVRTDGSQMFRLEKDISIGFIEPMLARPVHSPSDTRKGLSMQDKLGIILRDDCIFEPKLDGHRRIMLKSAAWSRPRGPKVAKIWTQSSFEMIQSFIPDGIVLDGELVIRNRELTCRSNEVSTAIAHDIESLTFVVFDLLYENGLSLMDECWKVRREKLEALILSLPPEASDWIRISEVYNDFEQLLGEMSDIGSEGLMIKRVRDNYSPGSRSKWFKYKFINTYDVVIVDSNSRPTKWTVRPGKVGADGILYPDGKYAVNWQKDNYGLSYGFYSEDGELIRVGSLGVTGTKDILDPHIGRVAEISGVGDQYLTGAVRHPVFKRWRDDKSAVDCIFNFKK